MKPLKLMTSLIDQYLSSESSIHQDLINLEIIMSNTSFDSSNEEDESLESFVMNELWAVYEHVNKVNAKY